MKNNYEEEIEIFYEVMIKPQLPKDDALYPSTERPEMTAIYSPTENKIHYFVKQPRNPIYMINTFYYDCGKYDLLDVINVATVYKSIKIEKR